MFQQDTFFWTLFLMLFFTCVQGCIKINISCIDIKTPYGYKFIFSSTMEKSSIIEVNQNGTQIANGQLHNLDRSPEVVHLNESSITTLRCIKLEIKYSHEKTGSRDCFTVTEETREENIAEPQSSFPVKTVVAVAVIALIVLILGAAALGYIPWKKKRVMKGKSAPFNLYLVHIATCSCFIKKNAGPPDNTQMENGLNAAQEQLLSVKSDGTVANGKNTNSLIDENSNKATPNGYSSGPVSNGLHQSLNGNRGHDPGGGLTRAETHSDGRGWTLGAQSPVCQKDNEPPSSQKLRSAEWDREETSGGEAIELVNSPGSSSPPVSTTPREKLSLGTSQRPTLFIMSWKKDSSRVII